MRPPGPVPGTWSMSTPSSRAIRRTDGAAGADRQLAARRRLGCRPRAAADVDDLVGAGGAASRSRRSASSASAAARPSAAVGSGCRGCAASAAAAGARLRGCGRRLAAAAASALRCGAPAAAVVDAQDRLSDLDLVAGLDLDVLDAAGDRRRHFDGRLVGFELEDRLIFRDVSPGLTSTRSTSPPSTFSPSSGSVKSVTMTSRH